MACLLCIGHRGMGCSTPGCTSLFPENTISSYKEAMRLGAHGIELDVYLTDSGQVIAIHGDSDAASIKLNAIKYNGSDLENFSNTETCESISVPPESVYIRKPWMQCNSNYRDSFLENGANFKNVLSEATEAYTSNLQGWKSDDDANFETLPTLENIIDKLGISCFYNIELKGHKKELGPAVLKILEKYPKLNVMISSFKWVSPETLPLENTSNLDIEQEPNGKIDVDLLRPIVNNKHGIPLGLLFNRNSAYLPSVERIVQCAKSYNAKWICVIHNFWKMPQAIAGISLQSKQSDFLNILVGELHKHDLKILTYWLQNEPDKPEDFDLHVAAKVDAICPNDVLCALNSIKKVAIIS